MDLEKLQSRFDRINKILSITISVKNIQATGTRTVLKKELVQDIYGYIDGYNFSVILSKIELEKTNINLDENDNNLITYLNKEYRLVGQEEDSKGIAIRFDFGDKYAN